MVNSALVLSAATKDNKSLSLPPEVAKFLDVSPLLCDFEEIIAIHDNPRFARLRDFDFRIGDNLPDNIGTGRRAENIVRHQHTNYDEMLRAAGGLLYPEQYEQVRKGVDLMVASCLRKPAGREIG
jgi:hypothetical protein